MKKFVKKLATTKLDENFLEWVVFSAFDLEEYLARRGGKNGFF